MPLRPLFAALPLLVAAASASNATDDATCQAVAANAYWVSDGLERLTCPSDPVAPEPESARRRRELKRKEAHAKPKRKLQEAGSELLVTSCGGAGGFGCGNADPLPATPEGDLTDCVYDTSQMELTFNDATVAHFNPSYVGCNYKNTGGNRWDYCQGTKSKFCVVGATGNEVEAIGHVDSSDITVLNPTTGWPTFLPFEDMDQCDVPPPLDGVSGDVAWTSVDDPGAGFQIDADGKCVDNFKFMGAANDDCKEGIILDNVSPQEPNLQMRMESYWALFRDTNPTSPTYNQAINPHVTPDADNTHLYPPYVTRNMEHTGFSDDDFGYKYMAINFNTPKDGRGDNAYYHDATKPWAPYYASGRAQILPWKISFHKGVGPDATPVTVPWMQMTFYDFDDLGADSAECIEVVGAWAFARYFDGNAINSEVEVTENKYVYMDPLGHVCGNAPIAGTCEQKRRLMRFCSPRHGQIKDDNPKDYQNLDEHEKKQSVSIFLKNVHAIKLTMSIGNSGGVNSNVANTVVTTDNENRCCGRALLVAGSSNVLESCPHPSPPPSPPPPSPPPPTPPSPSPPPAIPGLWTCSRLYAPVVRHTVH